MQGKVKYLLLPIGILVLLLGVPVISAADFLLVADDDLRSITQVNMADGTKRPLPLGQVTHPQAVSYDPRSDHVYWTDYWDEVILRAHRNGSGRETLVDSGVITADGLTLDLPGGNMFWTDRHAETVSVARLDGRYVRTLVSQDVGTLGDIVVDPANGYMFWTDWGVNCRIERAAMDGTGRVVLISYIFGTPRGLAIDYIEQRIYWSDAAYRTIQSVDLSGQNQIHLTMFRQAGFFGLALDNLNMYWTSWNVPYVVWTPKSSPNRHHALASGFPSPNGIYVNRTDAGAIPSSACSLSNGGCRELCLARPGGRTCACRNSWALQNDSASCSPIVPVSPSFLWIDRERTFDTSSVVMLAGDSTTVRGSPGSFPIMTLLTVKPPSYIDAIDYDFRQNLLFWVNPGQKKIYMTDFRLGSHRAIVHGISNAVKHLAADWLNQNLYYTDGVYNWIGMVNYNTSYHHVIIQAQLDRPRGIVVHPIRGFLFWNDWGKEPKIEWATLSGQNRTVVVKENLQRPSGMVIDYANDRLFWADTGLDVIESCDLDGSNRRLFYALPGTLFYDITFDGREIVIADWYHDRLIFANGTDEVTVGDSEDAYIFGVEFYDESRQPWIQSECQINNGDCQHTCVGGPDQHTCLCLPGYDLAKDKHTCIENLHMMADLNFTYVVQGHKVIAIDYDYAGKMLFYIQEGDNGTQSIQRLELLGQNDSFNIYTSGDGIDCIAVDWVSSNLYWTETLSGRIYVSRLDGSFRHVLIDNLNQPRGLAVHPPERLLFWTEVGRISSASLAGTNRRTVVPYNMNSEPIGIAIDLENDRLYWVDSLQGTMQSCNLTGGDVLVHWQADYVGLYGVTTFKDYVLWTDNTNHVIRMGVNNAVGQFVTTRLTELSTKPYGIRMYHEFQQMLYTGPCDLINGGCEGLCLPTTGYRICRCGHGGYLQPDGKSCWPDAPVTLPNSSPTPTTATAILPSTTATTTREPVALSTKTSTPTPAPAISSTVTTLTSASAISSTTTTTTPDPAISTTATTPTPAPAISSTTTTPTPTPAPAFSTTTTTPTSSAAISSTTTRPTPAPDISSTTTTLTSSPAISTTTTRPTSSPAISSKTTTPTPAPVILSTTTTTTPASAISSTPTTPTAAPAILSATTIKTTQAPAVARTTTTQIPQPVASSTTTTTPTPATAAISPPTTTTTTPTPPAIFSSTATATLAPTPGLTLFSSTTTTQLPTNSSSTTITTTSSPTISSSSTTTTTTSAPPAFSSTTITIPTQSPLAISSPFTTTTSTTTSTQASDSTPLKSSSPIGPTFGETCPQGQTIVVGLPADANGRAYINKTITAWDRNGQVLEVRGNPSLPGYITYSPEPQHVVLEATDGRGITASCSFTIMVKDSHPPRLSCPADIIHQSETPDDRIEWDEPIPEDNSGQTVSLTSNHGPGVRFLQYGVYTVAYTAVDGAGNQATCDFTISLQSPAASCAERDLPTVQSGRFSGCQSTDGVKSCTLRCESGFRPTVGSVDCLPSGMWDRSQMLSCLSNQVPVQVSTSMSFSFNDAPCRGGPDFADVMRTNLMTSLANTGICRVATDNRVTLCNDKSSQVIKSSCQSVNNERKRRDMNSWDIPYIDIPKCEEDPTGCDFSPPLSRRQKYNKRHPKTADLSFITSFQNKKSLHKLQENEMHKLAEGAEEKLVEIEKMTYSYGEVIRVKRQSGVRSGIEVTVRATVSPDTNTGGTQDDSCSLEQRLNAVIKIVKEKVTSGSMFITIDGDSHTVNSDSFASSGITHLYADGRTSTGTTCVKNSSWRKAVAIAVPCCLLAIVPCIAFAWLSRRKSKRQRQQRWDPRFSDLHTRTNPSFNPYDLEPVYEDIPARMPGTKQSKGGLRVSLPPLPRKENIYSVDPTEWKQRSHAASGRPYASGDFTSKFPPPSLKCYPGSSYSMSPNPKALSRHNQPFDKGRRSSLVSHASGKFSTRSDVSTVYEDISDFGSTYSFAISTKVVREKRENYYNKSGSCDGYSVNFGNSSSKKSKK